MMAPIDPNQLLKAFEPWLNDDGGIMNKEEVPRLSSLMQKYSKKLVSKCVYITVLQNTSPEVLETFLEGGGWLTLNEWLKAAKEGGNQEFMKELLILISKCPVNLNRLKENDTPKVIKSLSRTAQDEDIVSISARVVDSWTDLIGRTVEITVPTVTADSDASSSKMDTAKKVSKKRSKHDSSSNPDGVCDPKNEMDAEDEDGGGDKGSENKKSRKDEDGNDKESEDQMKIVASVASASEVADNENVDCDKEKDDEKDKDTDAKDKTDNGSVMDTDETANMMSIVDKLTAAPSTVVVKSGKSNLDGLINSVVKSVAESGDKNKKQICTKQTLNKDQQQQQLTAQTESNNSNVGVAVKKRDASLSVSKDKEVSTSSKPSTPTTVTTTIKESDLFANVLAVNSVTKSKLTIKRKIVRQSKVDDEDAATSINNILPKRASISTDNDLHQRVSPPKDGHHHQTDAVTTPPIAHHPRTPSFSRSNSSNPFAPIRDMPCPTPQGPSKSYPRGCLSMKLGNSSEKKKVRFLPDPWIKAVKSFEVEADERVNMYRINSMNAMAEMKGEANALKNHLMNDEETPTTSGTNLAPWILIPVDIPAGPNVVRGKNSVERNVQEMRNKTVLASIFMNKILSPDSPSEPDKCELLALQAAQNVASAPVNIPTDDLCTVADYSNLGQPEPKSNAMYGQSGFVATNANVHNFGGNANNYQLDPLIASASSSGFSSSTPFGTFAPSTPSPYQLAPSSTPTFSSTYNPRVVDYGNNQGMGNGSGNNNNYNANQNRGSSGRGGGQQFSNNRDKRSSIPCRDYINGKCKFTNCKYSHDVQQTPRFRSMNSNRNQGSSSSSSNLDKDGLDWG